MAHEPDGREGGAKAAALEELEALSDACERFEGAMGWSGERGYSRPEDERPWRAALERASLFLRARGAAGGVSDGEREVLGMLSALIEVGRIFWERMDEGERGRSLVQPAYEPMWNAARAEARRLLGKSEEGAPRQEWAASPCRRSGDLTLFGVRLWEPGATNGAVEAKAAAAIRRYRAEWRPGRAAEM